MIKVIKYEEKFQTLWNEFNKTAKNSLFMFDRNFMEYHKDRFVDNSLLFFDCDDESGRKDLCAILPSSLNGKQLISHGGLTYGGFIVDTKMKQHRMLECFEALRNYMKDNGYEQIVYKTIPYFYHTTPAQEDLYSLFVNNSKPLKIECSTVINFEYPIKLPKGRKAQISRAKRECVEVIESEDFNTFIDLENLVLSEKHQTKAVHTAAELQLLKNRFPENIKLYAAIKDGIMIAGSVIFIYDHVIHTQYLAANELAREIGALDLTISTIIDNYKDTKQYLDFGISTEEAGRVLNNGLISQKESFGGRTIVYQTWIMEA